MFTQRGGVCNQVNLRHFCVTAAIEIFGREFTRNFIKYQELCNSQPLAVKVTAKHHISVVFRVKLPLKLI